MVSGTSTAKTTTKKKVGGTPTKKNKRVPAPGRLTVAKTTADNKRAPVRPTVAKTTAETKRVLVTPTVAKTAENKGFLLRRLLRKQQQRRKWVVLQQRRIKGFRLLVGRLLQKQQSIKYIN